MARVSSALFFVVLFFWFSSAIAATHAHNNSTQNTTHRIISPFDMNKKGLLLHCALKGHSIAQVCPEKLLNKTNRELIASDCGSHPLDGSSEVSINYSRSLLVASMRFQSNLLFTGQLIIPLIHRTHPSIQSPIEHPPQHII